MPILFDLAGQTQYELPVGTGRMHAVPPGVFTPPAGAHMLGCQAGNKVYSAYSNLKTPVSGLSSFDPKTLALNPFGMKPFGWRWTANAPVLQGEVCTPPTPANGNGHTYQAQNSGLTGANPPQFPTYEGGAVNDNGIVWKELTMVLANRLPSPPAPVLTLGGGGSFGAGEYVFVVITLVNSMGESLPSLTTVITTTAGGQSVRVALPALAALPGWVQRLAPAYVPTSINIYAAAASGSPAPAPPPLSAYTLQGFEQPLGSIPTLPAITYNATTVPTVCTARVTPGQLPTPSVLPDITRSAGGGAFAAGRDVYVRMTYTNNLGETKAGPANVIVETNASDGVQVTIAVPEDENGVALYSINQVGIYEADVPTGRPAPPSSEFALVGYFAAGATPMIAGSASGTNPPMTNTTGPGGNIVADTATGGINGGQGYRYGSAMFLNANETFSGFTAGSVVKCVVYEDGWEIGAFNVATGPSYIVGRVVNFTVADGTEDGPFFWNGLVDLTVPAQNLVYPQTYVSDGIAMTATVFLDNVTTQGTFNFTDEYLEADNDATDRLRVVAPPFAVRVDYLESVDRLALTGVPGYYSGCLISLGEDYESFYGDTSAVPVAANGERAWGVTDKYKGIPFVIRERSGYVLSPSTGDPASWSAAKRWDQVGACGPRAWDACGKFIIFVHRSGIWKYDENDPDLVSKEVPREWSRVNWLAAETICCTIDEETHTVRVQVPTDNSAVPNEEIALSYLEGWQDPIHYSPVSGKEASMDAARRYSFNDVAAFVCLRMERAIPNVPDFIDGPAFVPRTDRSFYVSQLLYGSSAADGTVQARTPGVFHDNGAGIDWQYECVSVGEMQAVSKIEGINLNAQGNGTLYISFLAGRDMVTGPNQRGNEIRCRPVDLTPDQKMGISKKVPPKLNEYWRPRFTNGKQPDSWFSLKSAMVYNIPWSVGRGELDK